jgi:hypothetical protein
MNDFNFMSGVNYNIQTPLVRTEKYV